MEVLVGLAVLALAVTGIRGSGGGVIQGVEMMSVDNAVVVGKGGDNSASSTTGVGQYSRLGEIRIGGGTRIESPNGYQRGSSGGYYAGAGSAGDGQGRETGGVGTISNIRTGVDEMYASGGGDYRPPADDRPGDGADGDNQASGGYAVAGEDGCVIVRVPADQAAGVDPGSWVTRTDYYAEVTDGLVTDTYQERFYGDGSVRTENGRYASPEQPDDLIPCDPMVAEGWSYDGKEFTPPPPPPPPT